MRPLRALDFESFVYNIVWWAFYVVLIVLVLSIGSLAALLFLGASQPEYLNHSERSVFYEASTLLIKGVRSFIGDGTKLEQHEIQLLSAYGNSMVLMLSLFAIILPSFAISSKIRKISEIVPFDVHRSFWARVFRLLSFLRLFKKTADWYRSKNSQIIKDFAARHMLNHYADADEIIVISGDYSWLLDNKWSNELKNEVLNRIPGKIQLISYKKRSDVESEWRKYTDVSDNESLQKILQHMLFDAAFVGTKASLLITTTSTSYIHLYKDIYRNNKNESVCVFYSDKEAGELIRFTENRLRSELSRLSSI